LSCQCCIIIHYHTYILSKKGADILKASTGPDFIITFIRYAKSENMRARKPKFLNRITKFLKRIAKFLMRIAKFLKRIAKLFKRIAKFLKRIANFLKRIAKFD